MKIIILGSSGLLGSALCKYLKEKEEHDIYEWDIDINPLHDLRISSPYFDQYDFCFFLAFDVGGFKKLTNQTTNFINNNMKIMINTFISLEASKIPFIFASSQMENMNNPYGTLKKIGSQYTDLLGGLTVKFWNIYGPEKISIKSHVIPDFIDQYKKTGSITLLSDGSEEKQFLHIEDCARALECCMNNYSEFKTQKSIDVSSFRWIKIIDIAKLITNSNSKITLGPSSVNTTYLENNMKNEPDRFILDYWNPMILLNEGIRKIMDV